MKHQRIVTLTLMFTLAALMAACGGSNSTPTAAYKTAYDAMKNKDTAALKKVMPKKVLAEAETEAKKQNKSLDDVLKEMMSTSDSKLPKAAESKDEKIDGDKATLQIKNEKDEWETVNFVKEDDGWKISG
jgi:flagellar hook-basal body complex protein FliE